jgi:predicted transcriptional regulator
MYFSNAALERANGLQAFGLPPEVRSLAPREQEVAAIVYRNGLATAKDVEAQVAGSIRNASVRSFLNRLVDKGILLQHSCGVRGTLVYGPALTEAFARESAARQFCEDFYQGSLRWLADEVGEFYVRMPQLDELLDNYDRAPPQELRGLAPRMHEIATIVYRNGPSAITDIQAQLSDVRSRCGVRTLVNRMCERGIISKHHALRYKEIVCLPAIMTRQVRRLALRRFISARFDDSPGAALQTVLHMMRDQPVSG